LTLLTHWQFLFIFISSWCFRQVCYWKRKRCFSFTSKRWIWLFCRFYCYNCDREFSANLAFCRELTANFPIFGREILTLRLICDFSVYMIEHPDEILVVRLHTAYFCHVVFIVSEIHNGIWWWHVSKMQLSHQLRVNCLCLVKEKVGLKCFKSVCT